MENEMETTEQDNLEALPAVALARFIAGTITEGCGCDECLNRRDMVTTLVMGRNDINMTALAKAVANKD